jgi:hypothetical protein
VGDVISLEFPGQIEGRALGFNSRVFVAPSGSHIRISQVTYELSQPSAPNISSTLVFLCDCQQYISNCHLSHLTLNGPRYPRAARYAFVTRIPTLFSIHSRRNTAHNGICQTAKMGLVSAPTQDDGALLLTTINSGHLQSFAEPRFRAMVTVPISPLSALANHVEVSDRYTSSSNQWDIPQIPSDGPESSKRSKLQIYKPATNN